MKLYQLFFVTALFVHASLAASVHRESKNEGHQVFTSELAEAYAYVLPQSNLDETQDDEESDLREDNDVKISPSIYEDDSNKLKNVLLKTGSFHKEEQVPVAIVSDPVDVIITQQVKSDYKNVAFKELLEKKEDVVKEKKDTKKDETNTVQEDKKSNKDEVPLKDEKNSKPTENESSPKPVKEEVQKPEGNKKETQVVNEKDTLEKPKIAIPLSDEQVKQNNGESPNDPPPNPIQIGISTLQNIGQNIGQNLASLFRPPTGDSSPPPNIFQNFQQTLQNIVRPPTPVESDDVGTPPAGIVQQGIQSFQETIQAGIENLTQSFQNFINRPASDSVEGDSTASPPGILQQAVSNLQQGVQQSLSTLNTTLVNVFRPPTARPGLIQSGLNNFQEGVQNISSGLQNLFATPQNADSEGSPPNVIQQSIQNLSAGLQNGVDSINQTIQNAINPISAPSTTSRYPVFSPVIPQGLNIIRTGIQNALNKTIAQVFQSIVTTSTNETSTTDETLTTDETSNTDTTPTTTTVTASDETDAIQTRFRQELEVLNNTLHDGIKNITGYIETISIPSQAVQTTTLTTPVVTEVAPKKEDQEKVVHKDKNAEDNTVDHKIVKHD